MQRRVVFLGVLVALAACGGPVPDKPDTPLNDTGAVLNLNAGGVEYVDYTSDRALRRGKNAILFFYKPSDPFSEKSDSVIRAVYGTGAAVVDTYRVNYPTATGTRLTYGVIVEDTFVLLDASGMRVASFLHPTADEIKIILRGKIPTP